MSIINKISNTYPFIVRVDGDMIEVQTGNMVAGIPMVTPTGNINTIKYETNIFIINPELYETA